MKPSSILVVPCMTLGLLCPGAFAQPAAPQIEDIAMVPHLKVRSDLGVTNVIEYAEALATNQWLLLTSLVVTNSPYVVLDLAAPAAKRFYRVVIPVVANVPAPTGMALIPAGSFSMGNTFNEGSGGELPVHTVEVSAFYMDKYEVTKAVWDEVYNWAVTHGYSFDYEAAGKASNHPAQTMTWYDAVKWCNARSEKEGRVVAYYTDAGLSVAYRAGQVAPYVRWSSGYRLPTETEWEKAARGGASGRRFPWSDTDEITHRLANYYSSGYAYDTSATRLFHPTFNDGVYPYTSPVGYFAANGYGLYDMAGNVFEWCWDWYGSYSSGSQTDQRGPVSGSNRVYRGGGWDNVAPYCRAANRLSIGPAYKDYAVGFRSVLPPGQ